LNGRVASPRKPKVDFKQTVSTEEQKKFYNTGGLKLNDVDEIHRDLTYSGPIIATSFAGNVKAIKSFFIQNS